MTQVKMFIHFVTLSLCHPLVLSSPTLMMHGHMNLKIAEYLNTTYKEDQFVNIVKAYESTQPNMNSILKSTAKIIEELSQLSGKNDAKQDEMQHTKGRRNGKTK